MPNKNVKGNDKKHSKNVIKVSNSTDCQTPLWSFGKVDNGGKFRFSQEDINTELVIEKLISLSTMTWSEIKKATHDKGKSKNHELNYEGICAEGKDRIREKKLTEDADSIFSFALTNKIRLIGLKEGRVFYVIWYDPNHDFYPVNK